jgi:hypothetical protein
MAPRFLIINNNKVLEIDLRNKNHGDHRFDVDGEKYYYEIVLWGSPEVKSLYCHQSRYKL